eukprot:TRINITY_DN4860_c0_g1_i2.p1 TRINITY_DN4860_c0_g1~~TRINITY_DN4860_c0_g1_i2.p1  ORF type:complete len:114 (-),score=18.26 TRINITY_DN4860_c0_g1_i2:38-379(-)
MQRARVLGTYKTLLRAQKSVFRNDPFTSARAVSHIKGQFVANSTVTDPVKIEELLKLAKESAVILETGVVQVEEYKEGKWRVNITEKTHKTTNAEAVELFHKGTFKKCSGAPS